MKTKLIALLVSILAGTAAAQNPAPDSLNRTPGRSVRIPDRCFAILDYKLPRTRIGLERNLHRIPRHPGLDSLLSPTEKAEVLAEINARCDALGKDSLLTSDLFWVMRPYFDRLHHEDPHYRIVAVVHPDSAVYPKLGERRKALRQVRMPAFNLLQINDTLIVDRSLDPQFRRGDQITAINGIPAAEYLRYVYDDRHTEPTTLLANCFYNLLTERFRIDLRREGETLTVETPGFPYRETLFRLTKAEETEANIRTYADAGTGYIAIPKFFPNNSSLIRIVRKAIVGFQKQGLHNVILDLRRNPGSNGHAFDELLSIFIDKPVVDYCTGQRVKVS
ncbi:MAG: hypothetical protein K2I32_06790, partial [Alistipes sp.]|nr:hypothetical protein [Alistipes sp.]